MIPPRMARSASALLGNERSSDLSRIGSGDAIIVSVFRAISWIGFIDLSYDKTTPQVSTNLQRRIYNTRTTYGAGSEINICYFNQSLENCLLVPRPRAVSRLQLPAQG